MAQINAGRCIEMAQKDLDINNMRMARDFGVAHQQIARWRKSKDMRLGKLQQFADYFEMNIYEFLKLGEESNG